MKLEQINLDELKLLESNVRLHGETQIKEMIRSIEQFGQTRAIVIDEENNILIGNCLYMALKKMGKTKCYCFRKTGLSEKDKKKLVLSDNKIYTLGIDDYDKITEFIFDITEFGDFDIAGFDEDVLKEITSTIDEIDDCVMNSGKISDETVEKIKFRSENENIKMKDDVKEKELENVSEKCKHIICPSCGEVIYFD